MNDFNIFFLFKMNINIINSVKKHIEQLCYIIIMHTKIKYAYQALSTLKSTHKENKNIYHIVLPFFFL